MNQNTRVEITGQINLIYNENSPAFKKSLAAYNKLVSKGDKEDMLKHVAFHVTKFGVDDMVDGVGFVSEKDKERDKAKEPYSGIVVDRGYDDFEFEIR